MHFRKTNFICHVCPYTTTHLRYFPHTTARFPACRRNAHPAILETNRRNCAPIRITFSGKNPPPQITKLDIYPSAQITDMGIYLPARITILPFPAHLKITNHTLHGMPRIINMRKAQN